MPARRGANAGERYVPLPFTVCVAVNTADLVQVALPGPKSLSHFGIDAVP